MSVVERATARRSKIHGTGLFAKEDIKAGQRIIQYTGERITKREAEKRYEEQSEKGQIYLFDLNSRYDIDGSRHGNAAKYANHSCDPNAETVIEKGEIWILARKDIKKGAEITYDYNFPLFDHEKRRCRCGSANCRTWIINKDSFYYLRRKNRLARAAKKGARKAGKKAAKRSVKKAGKKTVKRSAKKGTKKAPKKGGKKAGKKAAKRRPRVAERHASG